MLKNLEMLLRSAELTHASDKFDFTTKEFGADKKSKPVALSVARRWPVSSHQLECDWLEPYRLVMFTQTRLYTFCYFGKPTI